MYSKNVGKTVKKNRKNRILTDNSDISQRTDGGNIFLDSSQQYIDSSILKNKVISSEIAKKMKTKQKQLQNQYNKNQKQELVYKEEDGNFSLQESFKFYTGQINKQRGYQKSRFIAINNCNSEQNSQNRKILKQKFKKISNQFSYSEQYYKLNSVKVNFILPLLYLFYHFFTSNWDWYLYLVITILNSIVQKHIFLNNIQFVAQPNILITITVFYIIISLISQYLIIRQRINVTDRQQLYKIYTHDGIEEQWKTKKANQIKPGSIFKVQNGRKIPTDSLLLNGQKSLIFIKQIEQDNYGINGLNMKETLVRSGQIKLPISGILEYKIQGDQNISFEWFKGKLQLQEPQKQSYQVKNKNIVMSNSINVECNECQLICMALQSGCDSFNLRKAGYPSLWKNHQNLAQNKSSISVKKIRFYFTITCFVCYLILCGVGVLVGYLSKSIVKDHPYLDDNISNLKILFYHVTNFIIFFPIFLNPSLLVYQILMTKIAQTNIKERQLLVAKSSKNKSIFEQQKNDPINSQKEDNIFLLSSKVTFKDKSIISYLHQPHILVLSTQLFKQSQHQCLKLIYLKDFSYQFTYEKSTIQQKLDNEQINLIKSFLSVSLLTYNNKLQQKQKSFFESLKKSAKQQFSLLIHKTKQLYTITGPLQQVFSGSKLSLIPYFTVHASKQYPYSLNFYQIPQQKEKQGQQARVLCILRGDPEFIIMKVYNKRINMLIQSEKIHDQKGFQVQLIGKFSCFYHEAEHLKNLYQNSTTERQIFYVELETYLSKVQPMGVLAFQNEFNYEQNKQLNQFLDMNKRKEYFKNVMQNQIIKCPNMILINPPQVYSLHPEQESVNTIKFILENKYLFNFAQNQISQKILYDPIPVDEMVEKLNKQKVIVFNGWSQQNLTAMLSQLRKKLMLMAVIEKQNVTYLTKLCHYSAALRSQNHTNNYADIVIEKNQNFPKTTVLLTLIQVLNYDSHIVYQGLKFILLIHIIKFICYFVVECINIAFTLGTGISLFRLPLYLLTQIIVFMDLFYHLNWKDGLQIVKKQKNVSNWWYQCIKSLFFCLIGSLVIIYSSVKPDEQRSSVFCILHVHLFVTHLLIFSKICFRRSISLYQSIVMAVQIAIYYIGMIIIGKVSLYQFNGVHSYMFKHKLYLVSILCIWIFLSFDFVFSVIICSSQEKKEIQIDHKYQKVKRVNKETNLQSIDLQSL